MSIPRYAEIGITTNFSFLRGGSHPQAYVHQASELRLPVIGIADHNTLAGVVRAYNELENPELKFKPKLLIGSRLVFMDGTPDILAYPRDRAAYGRLCQLLTRGKRGENTEKGECHLRFEDLLEFAEGQLLVLVLPHRFEAIKAPGVLERLRSSRADGVWLAASLLYRGDDRRRLGRLHRIATSAGVPLLATNEVLYHHPARRPLQDVLTCIREKTTIEAVGKRLQANAERHLKPAEEMARLFRDMPEAIAETMRFAGCVVFSLDQLKYQYPDEPVPPGKTAQRHLEDLTWQGAHARFPIRISPRTKKVLHKELRLIRKLGYAHYFLTVHDIVRYAREQKILCQGRGSAANSAVCYVLDITSVNPDQGRSVVRAFYLQGASGAARHRRRFRAFAARGGDAVCLPQIWPASRRGYRNRDSLPATQRDPRRRQGARADGRRHRGVGRYGLGQLGQGPQRHAGQAGRA